MVHKRLIIVILFIALELLFFKIFGDYAKSDKKFIGSTDFAFLAGFVCGELYWIFLGF